MGEERAREKAGGKAIEQDSGQLRCSGKELDDYHSPMIELTRLVSEILCSTNVIISG